MSNKPNEKDDSQMISEGDSAFLEDSSTGTHPKRKRSLEELLEGVSPENIHGEVDWGLPVGREVF
jgi:antitoxin component of MazEF toxin-antitoxin module